MLLRCNSCGDYHRENGYVEGSLDCPCGGGIFERPTVSPRQSAPQITVVGSAIFITNDLADDLDRLDDGDDVRF